MQKIIFIPLLLHLTNHLPGLGQAFGEIYNQNIRRADSLFLREKFKESGVVYNEAFRINGGLAYLPDRYAAVSAWAMAEEPDSAFFHLFRIIERVQYDELDKVLGDPTLVNLKPDPRWNEAVAAIRRIQEIKEARYDWKLIAMLGTVLANDHSMKNRIPITCCR